MKFQRPSRLLTRTARQAVKKTAGVFGVGPTIADELVVKPARFRRHPDFLQRLLQVDDDLAAVRKCQRDHAAGALVVDVHIGLIVNPVASHLDRVQRAFGMVLVFEVGHYHPFMVFSPQILGPLQTTTPTHGLAALVVASALMTGCGQKGPLFIATPPAAPAAAAVNPAPAVTAPAPAASAPR